MTWPSHNQFFFIIIWWVLLYSAILRSRADSLRSHVILHEWLAYFIACFWISTEVVYLQRWHGWCHMNLLPLRRVLCTPYNHAPCHFMQSHIHKVYACLAVTCHLHFWQDDRDLLRATAVTQGWNGYRNRSQHRKLTLEKKILLPLPQGFKPATFQSRVRPSNHWANHWSVHWGTVMWLKLKATLFFKIFLCPLFRPAGLSAAKPNEKLISPVKQTGSLKWTVLTNIDNIPLCGFCILLILKESLQTCNEP